MVLDPTRLTAFQAAYLPALHESVKAMQPCLSGSLIEDYTLDVAVAIMELFEHVGVEAAGQYGLNRTAFPATCKALGFEFNIRALENYLEGK